MVSQQQHLAPLHMQWNGANEANLAGHAYAYSGANKACSDSIGAIS